MEFSIAHFDNKNQPNLVFPVFLTFQYLLTHTGISRHFKGTGATGYII